MSKKVLILYGSPRKGGNSDLLCDEFARGAVESGHEVEKIYVRDQKIGYCRACYQRQVRHPGRHDGGAGEDAMGGCLRPVQPGVFLLH